MKKNKSSKTNHKKNAGKNYFFDRCNRNAYLKKKAKEGV